MQHLANANGDVVLPMFKPEMLRACITTEPFPPDKARPFVQAIVLDVETTGLDIEDTVIEIALLPFLFHPDTGALLSVGEVFVQRQDPGKPLDAKIIELTGITDADLAGQRIDWAAVHGYLANADLVIAHNAKFDRAMTDRAMAVAGFHIKRKHWACSFEMVDWGPVPPARKLPILTVWSGFWYPAHRADADVLALLYLLCLHGLLDTLYVTAKTPSVEVYANRSPRSANPALKARDYKFDGTKKVWFRTLWSAEDVPDEIAWLSHNVYCVQDATPIVSVLQVDPWTRFGVG